MPSRTPPPNASVADALPDGRLSAPSAERNADAILALLKHHGPKSGKVLELASGTGQHAVAFAAALPGLDWCPSEVDDARLASIRIWSAEAALANLHAPIRLDATAPGWGQEHHGQDLILLVNLLHLIPEGAAKRLIMEAAQALAPDGRFILYGPFLRDGETTSQGDQRFHESLKAQDTGIGYKDDFDVIDWIHNAGLVLVDVVEMPSNNLGLVARRPVEDK